MLGVSSEEEEEEEYEESEDEDNGRGYVYVEGDSEEEEEEEEEEQPKKKNQKAPMKQGKGNKPQNSRSKPGKRFQKSASPAAKKVGFHLDSAHISAL